MLQAPALSRTTEAMLGRHREAGKRLDELRTAAAKAAGVDVPELVELHRVSPTNLMMAIGTLVAAAVLLGQVGSPQEIWDTVKNAEWWLVGVALVLSLATNIPYAVALMGCVPDRLPLWPTSETQLAMSFGNLAIPAIGGIAIQIRYLQKRGLDLASAVGAGGLLSTVGNVVCQILLFVIAVILSPTTIDIGPIDTASAIEVVLIAIVVIFVAIGLIWGIPRLRKAIVPPVKSAASHDLGSSPFTASACAARDRQLRCLARLRVRAPRVHQGVRRPRQLLVHARLQHRDLDDRVTHSGPRRGDRGVLHRHVGRARHPRSPRSSRGRRDPHPTTGRELHPGNTRLVGIKRSAQTRRDLR